MSQCAPLFYNLAPQAGYFHRVWRRRHVSHPHSVSYYTKPRTTGALMAPSAESVSAVPKLHKRGLPDGATRAESGVTPTRGDGIRVILRWGEELTLGWRFRLTGSMLSKPARLQRVTYSSSSVKR